MPPILVWYNRTSSWRPWFNLSLVLLALVTVGLVFWSRSRTGVPTWVAPLTLGAALLVMLGPIVHFLAILALSLASPIPFVRRAAARALFVAETRGAGWSNEEIEYALNAPDPGLLAPFVDGRVRSVLQGNGASLLGSSGLSLREAALSGPAAVEPSPPPPLRSRRPFSSGSSPTGEGSGLIRAYASVDDAQADGWIFTGPVGLLGAVVIHSQARHPKKADTLWTFDGVGDPSDMVPDSQRRFGRLRYIRTQTEAVDPQGSPLPPPQAGDRALPDQPSTVDRATGTPQASPSP